MPRGHADATRHKLLEAGQEAVYLNGFQATSVDDIIARAGVTKGAFFYHFPTKYDFGYAIVDEVLAGMIRAQWVDPLVDTGDVVATIEAGFEGGVEILQTQQPILGCPLNNLAQEMNPLDGGFRQRTTAVFVMWQDAFRGALERAQSAGAVRRDLDANEVGHLLVAQVEGILSLARNSQDTGTLTIGARAFRRYLESLRTTPAKGTRRRL